MRRPSRQHRQTNVSITTEAIRFTPSRSRAELQPIRRLAKTLLMHAKFILNYYLHPITSGKMEGINNKIGRLTRVAYGYRDHEFLHLRILSLHESTFRLSGV